MRVILAVLLSVVFSNAFAQFTSVGDGNWNDGATWGNPSPGTEGVDYPGSGDNVSIASGHNIVIPSGYDASASNVIVGNFSNTDLTITSDGSLSFTGTMTLGIGPATRGRLFVNGTLTVEQGATIVNASAARIAIGSTGTYQHNYSTSAGVIYNATWAAGSTLAITGYTSNIVVPTGLGQQFSNFTWNCQSQESDFYLNGTEFSEIQADFSVLSTAGQYIFGLTMNNDVDLAINGDLILGPNVYFDLSGGSGNTTIHLGGDISINNDDGLGNFGGTGQCEVIFENQSGSQTFINQFQVFSNIDFSVASGSTLVIGENDFVSSSGAFNLEGTVVLQSLNSSGAVLGNIQTGSRSFSSGSTIEYNGNAAQFMGASHPDDAGIHTIINNASGISLTTNKIIGGDLTLTTGNLSVGARMLTLGGDVTANGNFIVVVPGSSLVINGSGPFGTFPFPAGAQTFTNFTLNRAGGSVVFANDVTLTGALNFTSGNLDFSGTTLTISGTFTTTGGLFASTSDASALVLNGNGTFGTLAFESNANTLGTLTMNRITGSASINSNLFVENQLNLSNGDLTNTSGLNIGDGAIVTRSSNSQLLGNPLSNSTGELYSLIYNGGTPYTTGLELPTTTNNDLLDLTISAPVTLDKSIIVNGDLTLQNSTLSSSSSITMAGNPGTWTNQLGSFDPGTGSVTITGNVTIVAPASTPQFQNLIANTGSTLTMPSGTTDIRGNLQLAAGSTFNANGGTIEFNGTEDQGVAGGGRNLNNITVNKGGGDLQLTSNVRLNGVLDIASATVVEADGNLTVVSTSDGTSGNGSIGPLASGASITGNVIVQRFMSEEGRIYRYISSPIVAAPVSQLQDDFFITGTFTGADVGCTGCTTNPSMFYYDETTAGDLQQGYFQYPVSSNTEILTPGVGYVPFIRENIAPGPVTIDLTGTVNQGTIVLPMTVTNNADGNADGYNLVGNPFPASINWDIVAGWSKNQIAFPIAVRDNGDSGGFLYWDGQGGSLPNGNIAAGQAFWARGNAGASLSINENAKISSTAEFFREETITPDVFQLVLTKNDFTDRAFVRYRKGATQELDNYDAPKLDNELFDISTLSANDIPMAINASNEMPCESTIRVHIKDMTQGSYTLTTEAEGVFTGFNPLLVDNFTNTIVDFNINPQYSFSVTSDPLSSASDRFSVMLEGSPIDPNGVTATMANTCEDGNYEVTLEGTQRGIYYFAELGGIALGDSVLSDGEEPIVLSVPRDSLEIGTNTLSLNGLNYCVTVPLANQVMIDHDLLYAASSTDVTDCEGSEVTIEASGAPAGGSYNWYEEETSAESIAGQHQNVFVTPALPKSKTYYVAAVNAFGCEGPRTAVKAEVIAYDPVEITESGSELTSSYEEGNQWYLDGVPVAGATNRTLKPAQTGIYSVEVDLGGCVTSAQMEFLVTGIDEFDAGRFMSPLENPFVDILRIRIYSTKKVDQISIHNYLGSKVGDMKLMKDASTTEGVFDMTSTASGMYFVKSLIEGRVYTLKVIKK